MCVCVENSFALVPCFPRDNNALLSSGFECLFSKLFGVFASFILCSFLPQLCFASGSRRPQSVCHILPADSLRFPASICCCCCNSRFYFTSSALRFCLTNCLRNRGDSERAHAHNRIGTGGMRENPYTQVRINKKNYPVSYISCLSSIGFACNNSKRQHIWNWFSLGLSPGFKRRRGLVIQFKIKEQSRARNSRETLPRGGGGDQLPTLINAAPRSNSKHREITRTFFSFVCSIFPPSLVAIEYSRKLHSLSEYWYPYNGQKKKKTSRLAYV